ncbi:MAG: hypothetical protein AABY10_03415 [Nanoarchaeota archaeon]
MAKEKELTAEQIREKQREHARKTLENKAFQGVVGSNNVRSNPLMYGELGIGSAQSTYEDVMNSSEANQVRTNLYKTKKAQGDNFGVYGEPSVNNYDVSMEIIQQIETNKSILSLRDLEEIVKNIGENMGYEFQVPDALKDYIPRELQEKIQMASIKLAREGKKIKAEDLIDSVLDEKERDALAVYNGILSKAYDRGVSLKTANYFADINQLGKQISEKYRPKEEKRK